MSQYTASTPGPDHVRPEIVNYFEHFYEVSDSPTEHEGYSHEFTKDATLIMGPSESKGRSGTLIALYP